MHSEQGWLIPSEEPRKIRETKYDPELSRSRQYGWKKRGAAQDFITSHELADKCVLEFLQLVDDDAAGKLPIALEI